MGKVSNGVNGQVSGKVGNVVFCKWKDITYVRSLPRYKKKRKKSIKQVLQRARFTCMQAHLVPILPLIRLGFRNTAPNRSGHNSAMSYNLKNAVQQVDEQFNVIPEQFRFSSGILVPPSNVSIEQKGDDLTFRWSLPEDDFSRENRQTLLLAYSPGGAPTWTIFGKDSHTFEEDLSIAHRYKPGDVLHAYMAFVATDGSGHTSDSVYAGAITIV